MSSLNDRGGSPRRRIERGRGMHPGWECALSMFASGILVVPCVIATFQWAALQQPIWFPAVLWILWIWLFRRGGKLAERLRPSGE